MAENDGEFNKRKEYIIPPTEDERRAWERQRVIKPNLPKAPPVKVGVGLPLPSENISSPNNTESVPFPEMRSNHLDTDPLNTEEKRWKTFESQYQEPVTPEYQEEFGKRREKQREMSTENANLRVERGQLDPKDVDAWIEEDMTRQVKNWFKMRAYESWIQKNK